MSEYYRRPGESQVRRVEPGAIRAFPEIPLDEQLLLSQLKLYEPEILEKLQKRLSEQQEQRLHESLGIVSKYLSTWTCSNCKHINEVSKAKLEEILKRMSKVEPKLTQIQYEAEEIKGKELKQLRSVAELVWIDGVSEDWYCEKCLETFYIHMHLLFSPLFPQELTKNPEIKPYWRITPQNILKGENEALEKPSEANSDLLRRIVSKYRDKTDALSRNKLSIALNELTIRGEPINVKEDEKNG